MEQWLRERGPTLRFKIPGATYIASADPEVVRQVLLGNADNYVKDIRSRWPPSSTCSARPAHQRRAAVEAPAGDPRQGLPHRRAPQRRRRDAPRRRPHQRRRSTSTRAAARSVDVGALFRRLTLQVIAEATLSMTPEESDEVLPRLYEPLVAEANKRVWLPLRAHLPIPARFHYDRSVRELDIFLTAKIDARWRQRQADPERRPVDMLDMLLVSLEGEPWTPATATL
jgi:hypothetical protein